MRISLMILAFLLSLQSFAMDNGLEAARELIKEYEAQKQLSPYQRAKKCPLKSTTYKELLDKIIQVRDSFQPQCKSKNAALIDQLNNSTNQLNTFINTNNQQNTTATNQNLTTALTSLSSLANKEECFYDIKENGVLPIISDVVLSVSQLGLIVPSGNGLVLAAGGALFSSALNIVDMLLSKKYDWSEADDRNAFLNFNCSFFELRQELSDAGLMSVATKDLTTQIADTETKVDDVKLVIESLKVEKEEKLSAYNLDLDNYLYTHFGDHQQKLLDLVKGWLEKIDAGDVSSNLGRRSIFSSLTFDAQDVTNLLQKASLTDQLSYFKVEIDTIFSELITTPENVSRLLNLEANQATSLIEKIKYYSELITKDLTEQKESTIKDWRALSSPGGQLNGKAVDAIDESYSEAQVEVGTILKVTENKLTVLNNLEGNKSFNTADEGTQINIDILDAYNEIQETIYGKVGKTYLEYVVNSGIKANRTFRKNLKFFTPESENQVNSCRNALKLREQWIVSNNFAELGYDFIHTNYGIFHDITKKFRKLLGIPVGISYQRILKKQSNSLEVLEKVQNDQDISKKEKRKFLKKKTIGNLILKIESQREKMNLIQKFITENQCQSLI